ncbi:MAG: urease accessory protein [Alphaproteobacteria bacterium]
MTGVVFLGLLLGMQHALEADHLAAVASIVSNTRNRWHIIRHGAAWGMGHMATLSVFAGAVVLSRGAVDPGVADGLETVVGVMLIVLGGNVVYRLIRERIHIHVHRHGDDDVHIHAHSHAGEAQPHGLTPHDHEHRAGFPVRSLLVGVMHGLAGSAVLVVLTASALETPLQGVGYVLLFGLGSVIGMALLSAVISIPLTFTARHLTWAHYGIRGVAGTASIVLGAVIAL